MSGRAAALALALATLPAAASCGGDEPPPGPVRIAAVRSDDFRAVVEEQRLAAGTRVTLILVDAEGREAALLLQDGGPLWARAEFTHDEDQQWFLHPGSARRPPLVHVDLVFGRIRIGDGSPTSLEALDWVVPVRPRVF